MPEPFRRPQRLQFRILLKQLLAVDSTFPRARMVLGRALFFQGQREAGNVELKVANPRKQEALEIVDRIMETPDRFAICPGELLGAAIVSSGLGEKDRALDLIEKSFVEEWQPPT